ncbi:hypothetical protein R0G64_19160 [Pseudomonas otitidis]|uniref:Uncharacterized protein n=1 Tax=Metapseudomonas otitidis TaxID=319939 RepID=A0ABU3XVB7_9GAMM|nr:hypothetical protein [Pseudomonas otitidis]MDV3441546.1 hypothetical protein [Pseudomonas otitidis]
MNSTYFRKKSASLIFRGLDEKIEKLTSFFGVPASSHGVKGQPVRENMTTPLVRSYVIFSENFPSDEAMQDMLPKLFCAWAE